MESDETQERLKSLEEGAAVQVATQAGAQATQAAAEAGTAAAVTAGAAASSPGCSSGSGEELGSALREERFELLPRACDDPAEVCHELPVDRVVTRVERLERLVPGRDQDPEERDLLRLGSHGAPVPLARPIKRLRRGC